MLSPDTIQGEGLQNMYLHPKYSENTKVFLTVRGLGWIPFNQRINPLFLTWSFMDILKNFFQASF